MVIEQRIYNYVKSLAHENYSVKRSIIVGNGRGMASQKRVFEPKRLKSVRVIADDSIERGMWESARDDIAAYFKRDNIFFSAVFQAELWKNGEFVSMPGMDVNRRTFAADLEKSVKGLETSGEESGDWTSFKEKYAKVSKNSEVVFLITSYEKLKRLEEQDEVSFAGRNNLVVIYVEPGERRISEIKGVRCFYLTNK